MFWLIVAAMLLAAAVTFARIVAEEYSRPVAATTGRLVAAWVRAAGRALLRAKRVYTANVHRSLASDVAFGLLMVLVGAVALIAITRLGLAPTWLVLGA
jgi:hypothetical protein